MRPVLTIALLLSLSFGCVRIRDDEGGGRASVSVATATARIDRDRRLQRAEFFDRMANDPPKTVSEWAEKSMAFGEAVERKHKEEFAKLLEPLLSSNRRDAAGNDTDELDPAKAKRVFAEIAKGLRR